MLQARSHLDRTRGRKNNGYENGNADPDNNDEPPEPDQADEQIDEDEDGFEEPVEVVRGRERGRGR